MSDYPKPCVSNMHFAEQFPGTLKRAEVAKLTGWVLGEARNWPDCYHIKWRGLKQPWQLHKSFFRVVPAA